MQKTAPNMINDKSLREQKFTKQNYIEIETSNRIPEVEPILHCQ